MAQASTVLIRMGFWHPTARMGGQAEPISDSRKSYETNGVVPPMVVIHNSGFVT